MTYDRAWRELADLHRLDNAETVEAADHRLGSAAVARGWISNEQLDAAVRAQRERGAVLLGQVLLEHGFLSMGQLGRLMERRVSDVPSRLGRYEILAEIGQGGMGRVYRAFDPTLKRTAALKVIRELADAERIKREAQASARLQHPNIVTLYDVGEQDGLPYLAMELIDGEPLLAAWKDWTWRQRAEAVAKVSRAIAYAHAQGVIHRDLKPGNVMVARDGTLKVMDFGLARVMGEETMTVTGSIMGTPAYMAPEQVRGERATLLSDVYALGVMLYEAVAGRTPFDAEEQVQLCVEIVAQDPVPPRVVQPKLPEAMNVVCLKALEKVPARRYAGAIALAEDVERLLRGDPILARPPSVWTRTLKQIRRRPLAALTVAFVALIAVGSAWSRHQAGEEAERLVSRANASADFIEARHDLLTALRLAPGMPEARAGMARIHLDRYLKRERAGDEAGMREDADLVRLYDDDGRYESKLRAVGWLRLATSPSSAVDLHRYENDGGVMRLGSAIALGTTPIETPLDRGSYLLVAGATRIAVWIDRDATVSLDVPRLDPGDGFVYVPPGPFIVGVEGASLTVYGAEEKATVDEPVFFIGRHEVMWREYRPFAEATGRWPRNAEGERLDLRDDWPVAGVSWHDAVEYCRWRSDSEWTYALPTARQWEKAARGADGRTFPWGDRFDPTFCRNARSSGELGPVGAYPTDESPYGLMDCAGGVSEWCAEGESGLRMYRGGSWLWDDVVDFKCAARDAYQAAYVYEGAGFRVVRTRTP